MRFTDRVALVTGGAQGIGAECVRRLSSERAAVVIVDVDPLPARKLADDIEASGGTFSVRVIGS